MTTENIKKELRKINSSKKSISDSDKGILESLSKNFKLVWDNNDANIVFKKQIVRILINEIIVDIDNENALIKMIIHWAGGCHTTLNVKKNRTGQHGKTTDKSIVEIVKSLSKICSDEDIAKILNRLKFKTGKGLSWTESRVRSLRCYRKIPIYLPSRKIKEGWLNMKEAADFLGISPMSVRRLIKERKIEGYQIVPYAPWIIYKKDINTKEIKNIAKDIHNRYTKK